MFYLFIQILREINLYLKSVNVRLRTLNGTFIQIFAGNKVPFKVRKNLLQEIKYHLKSVNVRLRTLNIDLFRAKIWINK